LLFDDLQKDLNIDGFFFFLYDFSAFWIAGTKAFSNHMAGDKAKKSSED